MSTTDGLQVPVIPLLDVVGNTGAVVPLHIGAGVVNAGMVRGERPRGGSR